MFCPTEDPSTGSRMMDGTMRARNTISPLKKGTHAHALRTLLMDEFEQTRKLIERKVLDAPKRATENTIHEFSDTLLRMHMHGCMLTACGNIYRRSETYWRGIFWAALGGSLAVVGRMGWLAAFETVPMSSSSTATTTGESSIAMCVVADHLLTPTPWIAASKAVWKVGVVGLALAGSLWTLGTNMLERTASEVLERIDDIWTEFGFSIRDGVLHRRRNAKSPNLVRSKWPTDADEEVLALWRRARPQVIGTLRDHYNTLSDVPVLTTEDEELISHMLRTDGAKLNDLARS